jgi:hypothetical protein
MRRRRHLSLTGWRSRRIFFADNLIHKKIHNIAIELYTDKKDLAAEAALEAVLDSNGITYETIETWIQTEELFQKTYMIGVI